MGASEAELLVREGVAVMIADVLEDEGRALATRLGVNARFERLDVRDEENWSEVVALTRDWLGGSTHWSTTPASA
jgi:3alpha(or 20beta)-hydroxysteroid dehydrogenase